MLIFLYQIDLYNIYIIISDLVTCSMCHDIYELYVNNDINH